MQIVRAPASLASLVAVMVSNVLPEWLTVIVVTRELGRELINGACGGLPESALERRAALGRRKWHFRKVCETRHMGADLPCRRSARSGHHRMARRRQDASAPRERMAARGIN